MTYTNSVIPISASILALVSINAIIVMLLGGSGFIFTKVTAITSTSDSDANQILSAFMSMMKSNNNSDNSSMQMSQTQEPMAEGQSPSLSSSFSFNPEMPLTIPLVDGYYNGTRVFFIHSETSDKNMADMMTQMINFPSLYVPELAESVAAEENLSKVYVFTNGVPGSGPYGGGPFMFQIDIFDSIPGQENYTHLRAPYLVTWNDNATARILTSVVDIMKAEGNGELTIQRADNIVVNAPILAWLVSRDSISGGSNNNGIRSDSNNLTANDVNKTAPTIDKIFLSMPNFEGQVIHIDTDHYIARMKLGPIK